MRGPEVVLHARCLYYKHMTDSTMAAGSAPSTNTAAPSTPASTGASVDSTTFAIILSLSFCHLLNDMMQSLVPALYPILKESYALSFGQVGLITLAFQCTASMLQPLVGLYTDRKPQPYSLMVGMGLTLVGLLMMSQANTYPLILLAAALIGMGSSVFHPESSRVARMASGGQHGLAQSVFQVGGNAGSAIGPLLSTFTLLMPSMVNDINAGVVPAITRLELLLLSTCTPGSVVSVVMGLVDPFDRAYTATGRSTSSCPVLVDARLD